MKLATVSGVPVSIWQFRENDNRKVDFPLQGPGGAVVGIEVRATTSPGTDTAKHLRWLSERLGDRFIAGIVLHLGQRANSGGKTIQQSPSLPSGVTARSNRVSAHEGTMAVDRHPE